MFVLLIIFLIGLTFLKLKGNLKEKVRMSQVLPYFRFHFYFLFLFFFTLSTSDAAFYNCESRMWMRHQECSAN